MQSQPNGGPAMERTRHPGIYKRGSRYVVVWRHRGKQHKEFFRTLAEAREAKGQRQSGDRRPRSRVNFEDYFQRWIDSYAGRTARGFSDTTRPEYRRPIEQHALPRWRTWTLEDVEPADVRELFAATRERGATASTIRKLRVALSALFATAVEENALRSNPVQGVRIPQAPADEDHEDGRPKALTRNELSVLLSAIPADWRLFFELLTHTGLRISEAIGLTWQHVELGERPRLKVTEQFYEGQRKRLKSRKARREIPLSEGMAGKLRAHRRDTYRDEDRPVFPSKRGTELNPSNVRGRVLSPAAERAGLGWVSFHTFRHTCASLLFEAGKNVKQVQEWLGHASPAFTLNTYVHLMDDGLGDADFLDNAVALGSEPCAGGVSDGNRSSARSWSPKRERAPGQSLARF
jgi:integrase